MAFGGSSAGAMQFKAIAALVVLRLKQAVDETTPSANAESKTLVSLKWEVLRMGIVARGRDA